MSYASVADYEARYGEVPDGEKGRIETLIADASRRADSLVARYGIDVDEHADVLAMLVCEYVRYRVDRADAPNVSSVTYQAGSFMETRSMRAEIPFDRWAVEYFGAELGISTGSATTAKIAIHDRSGAMPGDLNAW